MITCFPSAEGTELKLRIMNPGPMEMKNLTCKNKEFRVKWEFKHWSLFRSETLTEKENLLLEPFNKLYCKYPGSKFRPSKLIQALCLHHSSSCQTHKTFPDLPLDLCLPSGRQTRVLHISMLIGHANEALLF